MGGYKMTYFLSLTFFSILLWGLPEKDHSKVYELLKNENHSVYQQVKFTGAKKLTLTYTQFGFSSGANGTLVIAPGRRESSLKYIEVAHDFINKGFSPVFVIDHQGQGFSDRLLADKQKGHVHDFNDYVRDFSIFTDIVLNHPLTQRSQLHLISHSMGGAITAEYLVTYNSPYKRAVLSSPMLQIKNEKSEAQILHETFLACYVKRACDDYIPGGGPFNWSDRRFSSNDATTSRVRFEFQNHLWRAFPQTQLGDPTIRWVRESVQANVSLREDAKLNRLKTPLLLLLAENDQVVENRAAKGICSYLGQRCKKRIVRHSRHEILMERDSLRTPAINEITRFLNSERE